MGSKEESKTGGNKNERVPNEGNLKKTAKMPEKTDETWKKKYKNSPSFKTIKQKQPQQHEQRQEGQSDQDFDQRKSRPLPFSQHCATAPSKDKIKSRNHTLHYMVSERGYNEP